MATMGYFDQYKVVIESLDHNPPHVHIKIGNKTVTRIEIPHELPIRTYDLFYLKNATRLSSSMEKAYIEWLGEKGKHMRTNTNTNLEWLQLAWDLLHESNKFKLSDNK